MKKYIYLLVVISALFLVGCADAGKDQEVTSGETVTLDGSASKADFFGEIKKYQWKQVKHKHHKMLKVVLSDKHAVSPTFTAPIVSKKTIFVFHLVTMERGGYYSPWKTKDEVTVIVNPPSTENKLPQAMATVSSETIKYGESVTFDASASTDSDGEIVSYEWKDVNGTVLGSEVTFAHVFETVGTHTVTLTVTDNDDATSSTSLTVTVNALQKPIADINASATLIFINDTITFDANGSSDSDGELVSYTWKDVQGNVLSDMKQFTYTFTTSGEHNITLSVMDDDEQISTATITITVQAELLSVSLSSDVSSLEVNETTQLNATASYNDNTTEDVSSSVEWIVGDTTLISIDANGTLKALQSGTTSIIAKVGDIESNSISIEITQPDTTPPTLTLNGEAEVNLILGSPYSELGATATDDRDENVTITQSGNVDVNSVGTYTITYTATDKAGNTSTLQRTVNVVLPPDVTAPTLTLNGESTVTLFQGSTYTELGATANDERDGNISVTVSGNVNTSVLGTYKVIYTATDTAGNTGTIERTVNVVLPPDVLAPTLTLNGESEVTLYQGTSYTELGANATDVRDGDVNVTIAGEVDVNVLGTYTLTYTATDKAGNEATATRTINVVLPPDVTAPLITLNGENEVSIFQDTPYSELGATATDDRDTNVLVSISGNVDTSTLGSYVVTYTAADTAGNSATTQRTVNVVLPPDTEAPVTTLNGEQNITLSIGEAYEEPGATAIDEQDGDVNVTIEGNVNTILEGNYRIKYIAVDQSGNKSQLSRYVSVEREKPISVKLISEKTHFIRNIDTLSNRYVPVKSYVKVLATYDDGRIEEVTDNVSWNKSNNTIGFAEDFFRAKEGNVTISATFNSVKSNELTIEVRNETSKFFIVEQKIHGREALVYITLPQRPTNSLKLKFRLDSEDNVVFKNNKLTQEFIITPEMYDINKVRTVHFFTIPLDENNTHEYTIITEPIISDDTFYADVDPQNILVQYESSKPKLLAPELQELRGAIRGTTINFRVIRKSTIEDGVEPIEYRLIDPPEGVKIIKSGRIHNEEDYYVQLQWDIPLDAEEGKTQTITLEAKDLKQKIGVISFDIFVPRTTTISSKIENNELTVTDKNSPLYGMKMKAHNGDEISSLKLRSVDYGDVWKVYNEKPLATNKKYIVFIVDNIPKALDLKFPNFLDNYEKRRNYDTEFYQYSEQQFTGSNLWGDAYQAGYNYEGTKGLVVPFNGGRGSSSKVFILIINN